MNRRAFLGLLGLGAPAALVASKVGLWDKFLAWVNPPPAVPLTAAQTVALQLEKVREHIPVLYENDSALHGMLYDQTNATTGEWNGIARAEYPKYMAKAIRGGTSLTGKEFRAVSRNFKLRYPNGVIA